MQNRLFVAYKPPYVTSNQFLVSLKKRYKVKKAGFSGTLDPFAKGVLIVAFGNYTKLFRFLAKTPKSYRATLWLGAASTTLDIEGITQIATVSPFNPKILSAALSFLKGKITYTPPAFCAKKIAGQRAYNLARSGKEVSLKEETAEVYDIRLISYCHPFVTFEADVSEGTYIRSLGDLLARKLGTIGALSSLKRLREGRFVYENERALDPLEYLDLPTNTYLGSHEDLELGRKLLVCNFSLQDDGLYVVRLNRFFSIIEIKDQKVEYILNQIPLFDHKELQGNGKQGDL